MSILIIDTKYLFYFISLYKGLNESYYIIIVAII